MGPASEFDVRRWRFCVCFWRSWRRAKSRVHSPFLLNTSFRKLVTKWMPAIVWMLFMFFGSTDVLSAEHTSRFLVPFLLWLNPQISPATIVSIHFALRKLGHLLEYAILSGLLWRALRGTLTADRKLVVALSTFLLAAVFATSDEYHQSFVPSRTASAHDVMIDCIGAFVAVLLCWIFARQRLQTERGRTRLTCPSDL
jgi:VanZ family protein